MLPTVGWIKLSMAQWTSRTQNQGEHVTTKRNNIDKYKSDVGGKKPDTGKYLYHYFTYTKFKNRHNESLPS